MMTRRPTLKDVRIRPLIETGIAEVEEIELLAFTGEPYVAWDAKAIYDAASAGGRHVAVIARAETGREDHVLGWAFYRRDKYSTTIIRLAVHPSSWRRGIGSMLLEHIAEDEPHVVGVSIDESDYATEDFLESQGFKRAGGRFSRGQALRHFCLFRRQRR